MRQNHEAIPIAPFHEPIESAQLPLRENQVPTGRILRGLAQPEILRIVPYDDRWPSQFEFEKNAILAKINPCLYSQVEHVGSTSIQGLAAKPCIDIMIGVTTLQDVTQYTDAMLSLGYHRLGQRETSIGFRKNDESGEAINYLYFVIKGSQYWNDVLNFRNMLQANDTLRDEYLSVKLNSLDNNPGDRKGYVLGKSEFVKNVLMLVPRL